jgi:4-hydroxybenzoate polyprenyltransferase
MSHFVLGLSISAAPLGAWIAVRGTFDFGIVPLVTSVIFWLAGFDILYALQDIDFDRKYGLYSIPKRFGIRKAIHFSRIFHAMSFIPCANDLFELGLFTGLDVCRQAFFCEHSH